VRDPTLSGGPVSGTTLSGATLSGSIRSGSTVPGGSVTSSTAPTRTVPGGTVPGGTVPDIMWRAPYGRPGGLTSGQRGIRGRLLALVHAAAFVGLLLAGTVLLIVTVAPVVVIGLGLGNLVQDLVRGSLAPGGQDRAHLIAVLAAAGCCWLVLPAALLAVRRLARRTRRLSARWCGVPIWEAYTPTPPGAHRGRWVGMGGPSYRRRMSWLLSDPATWRDLAWLAVNAVVGQVLLLVPLLLIGVGIVVFIVPGIGTFPGFAMGAVPRPAFPGNTRPVLFLIGMAMVAAGTWFAPLTLRGYAGLARWVLAPSGRAELELRVAHLAKTRSETLDTGAAELRRIERDLHDGAQARLVAMGLTLDAAGRLIDTDPAAARALLYEARDASVRALAELRDLVRGIHPPVLADRGLADAVRAMALDSPLKVRVTGMLPGRPPAPVESAAYFAVSELLANVAKHSGAGEADVDLRHESGALRVIVRDDGTGGADPSRGTGLSGIARRLAAFDGVLVVNSPAGGPTEAILDVPCALS
jgi:signal transduction histidine kinase